MSTNRRYRPGESDVYRMKKKLHIIVKEQTIFYRTKRDRDNKQNPLTHFGRNI